MCSLPTAPPLPPSFKTQHSRFAVPLISASNITLDSGACKWALDNPPLWDTCAKHNICLYEEPYKYKYRHFEPILQAGPTCGMVALSMLLGGKVTASEMLNVAKYYRYSNNGEMFSSLDMGKLIHKVVTQFSIAETRNINWCLRRGGLFSHEIIEKLLSGVILLVPYDADFNHSPCLKRGHKAHWALVCGIIVISDPGVSYTSDPNNVIVLCRHGKSKHLSPWSLEKLEASNKNLWELSPKREDDDLKYILPEGGIGGDKGLRDQYLLFQWL